jgi:molecular chaperone GrpE
VFRKFGVEKYDAENETFDPHRHMAVFEVPDPSKPPGTVAVVLKVELFLHSVVGSLDIGAIFDITVMVMVTGMSVWN